MIEKTITINGIQCKFKASAALPRIYRAKFKKDIFSDLSKLKRELDKNKDSEEEFSIISLETFENIAYLMNKYGDPHQPNNIEEWLEQFEVFDIYQVLPEILDLWALNTDQKSVSKKKNVKQSGK